jgi:hypothetical protein
MLTSKMVTQTQTPLFYDLVFVSHHGVFCQGHGFAFVGVGVYRGTFPEYATSPPLAVWPTTKCPGGSPPF